MTKIVYMTAKGQYTLQAKGHAGDSRVCAAVSAILQMLMQGFFTTCRGVGEKEEGDGLLRFSVTIGEEYQKAGEVLMEVAVSALLGIEKEYSDCIMVAKI